MQSLMCDLENCSFVACPGSTVSALHDQYTRDLSNLLDKHAPLVTRTFTKGAAGWLSDTYLQAKAVRRQLNGSGRKTSLHKIGLDSVNKLLGATP